MVVCGGVRGSLWWSVVVCGGLWWSVVFTATPNYPIINIIPPNSPNFLVMCILEKKIIQVL